MEGATVNWDLAMCLRLLSKRRILAKAPSARELAAKPTEGVSATAENRFARTQAQLLSYTLTPTTTTVTSLAERKRSAERTCPQVLSPPLAEGGFKVVAP
jgi:hypothetical protein